MNQLATHSNGEAGSGGQGAATASQYLTFRIGEEAYATEILQVKEILQYETITRVPSTPRSIRGVMNLRGSVVPVVDLAVKFGLPESPVTKRTCVIIVEVDLEGDRTVMGIMADSVSEVVELKPKDIEPPPPFGTRVKVDYLVGMGKSEKKFLLILDIDRVLTTEEISLASEFAQASPEVMPGAIAAPPAPTPHGSADGASKPAARADVGLEQLLDAAPPSARTAAEEGDSSKVTRKKGAHPKGNSTDAA